MSAEELMSIDPQELRFPFDLKEQISRSFKLSNKTANHLAFKVKTTAPPKKYAVETTFGIVKPRSTKSITVTMLPQREATPDMQCKDKFCIKWVVAPPGATPKEINRKTFKKLGIHVEEYILKVIFVHPLVPEEPKEVETFKSSSTVSRGYAENHGTSSKLLHKEKKSKGKSAGRKQSKKGVGNHAEERILKVVYVDPSRRPSPVLEEPEEETSGSCSTVSRGYAETSSEAHQIRSTSSWLSDNFGDGELPELVLQLDLPLEELKVMLLEDKVSVQPQNSSAVPSVVLLSAPPGCGKTMLANMVCRDSTIKDKFKENIFFVTVPKRVTVKVIVQQVFQQKGCLEQLPEVQSDKHAINQLRQLLEGIGGAPDYKPILLVLDDVRSPGMKSLVRMFMFEGIQGYKILVTSRFDPIGFQSVYRLKPLNYQDAMVLFRHYAFLPWRPVSVVPYYLVNEIVKGSKGFPLALTVLGLSLSGKPEVFWKNTLSKWSKGKSDIFESDGELLNNLKTILDVADEGVDMEKVRECFLHLQSLDEDQMIPATLTDSNAEFLAYPRSITVKEGSFCHVFLSFRGEVRNDFTYFLYDALKADGFVPFMDKRDMYAGEDVQLGIEEGIKNSMSSIVIFSKNFAFSSFCLDELMLLLERKRTSKYFIIPIHYGVKSTDVRRQLGTFREALEKHKANYNEDQIEKWREALTEAGKILGERFDGSVHVPDFIQTFVKVFRKRFADKFPEHPMPSPRIPVPH